MSLFSRMIDGIPKPHLSGAELAAELDVLLEDKAHMLDETRQYMESMRDPDSDTMRRLHQESYHELFIDTPSKELLWRGEQILAEFSEEVPFRFCNFKELATVDLIEAHGFIAPVEGYRLLKTMDENHDSEMREISDRYNSIGIILRNSQGSADEEIVEALAKFGRVTSPDFIKKARDLALCSPRNWGKHKVQMLLDIANFGNDPESLELAYQSLVDDAENNNRPLSEEWEMLIRVAALGHRPALQAAKQALLEMQNGSYPGRSKWAEAAATIELIEEGIRKGNILLCLAPDACEFERTREVQRNWDAMLVENRRDIVDALRKAEIPNADGFSRALFYDHNIQNNLPSCSTIQTPTAFREYVHNAISNYVGAIIEKGPESLPDLLASTKNIEPYKRSRNVIKKEYYAHRREHENDFLEWAILFHSQNTLDDKIKAENYQLQQLLPQINLLCLVRAISISAVQLARY